MRLWKFIAIILLIFLIERLMPYAVSWPALIFPAFAAAFLTVSRESGRDLIRVLVSSVFFDFFSGYEFGYFTLAVFIMVVSISWAKRSLIIGNASFIAELFFLILFDIEFLALGLLVINFQIILTVMPVFIAESIVVYFLLKFIIKERTAKPLPSPAIGRILIK